MGPSVYSGCSGSQGRQALASVWGSLSGLSPSPCGTRHKVQGDSVRTELHYCTPSWFWENWRIGCWGQKTPQNFQAHLEAEPTEAPEGEESLPEVQDVDILSRNSWLGLSAFTSGSVILTSHNPALRGWSVSGCIKDPGCHRGIALVGLGETWSVLDSARDTRLCWETQLRGGLCLREGRAGRNLVVSPRLHRPVGTGNRGAHRGCRPLIRRPNSPEPAHPLVLPWSGQH